MTTSHAGTAGVPLPRSGGSSQAQHPWVRNVRIGRQGVYTADRALVGYELLFRDHDGALSSDSAGQQATSQVIASTFGTFGVDNISDGRPLFINVTRAFLTGMIALPVGPENVVIEVVDHVTVDQELLMGLAELREQGYRIAADDYTGSVDRAGLLEVCDYVKIDFNRIPLLMVDGLVAQVRSAGAQLVAEGIEDASTWQRARDLNFDLYQGYYLAMPQVLEKRTLSPSHAVCVRLLNDLGDPDTPISRIEQLVGSDPGLAMRLLRTANSAQMGQINEVTSLRQALVVLGPQRVRSWVMLTLLEGGSSMNPADDLWALLARALVCQRIARAEGDVAYTVGLLHGAAQMIGCSVEEIAETAGLGAEVRSALLQNTGPAGDALQVVQAHARDDFTRIIELGFSPFEVSAAHLQALSEVRALVNALTAR